MPFLVASLAILFYIPYIAYRSVNSDLINLENTLNGDDLNAKNIANYYFDLEMNPQRNNLMRDIFNILIKILYLVANLVALLVLDDTLNGEYLFYGYKWIIWFKLNRFNADDYMGMRDHPRPGNNTTVLVHNDGYTFGLSELQLLQLFALNSFRGRVLVYRNYY